MIVKGDPIVVEGVKVTPHDEAELVIECSVHDVELNDPLPVLVHGDTKPVGADAVPVSVSVTVTI